MRYGRFLYSWSRYSTAQFGDEFAISITRGEATLVANITTVVEAGVTVTPDSIIDGDVVRIRVLGLDVTSVSGVNFDTDKLKGANATISSQSNVSSEAAIVYSLIMEMAAVSATVAPALMRYSSNISVDSTSNVIASPNTLMSVSMDAHGQSQLLPLANASYYAGMIDTANSGVTWSISLLYDEQDKENETYTNISAGSDLYTLQTKQNESYEVING